MLTFRIPGHKMLHRDDVIRVAYRLLDPIEFFAVIHEGYIT